MNSIRRQLTLFVPSVFSTTIEAVRKKYNPIQHELIAAHVTLCREDEIENWKTVSENLKKINSYKIKISFAVPERFSEGKGVFLPHKEEANSFHELRKKILKNAIDQPRNHEPHITLMHPRNSTCTGSMFKEISVQSFPSDIVFDTLALIEQKNGGTWKIVEEYKL